MVEIFKELIVLYRDKEMKLSSIIAMLVLFVAAVVVTELSFGIFSSLFNASNIDQLIKVETQLNSPGTSPESKEYLLYARQQLIHRGTIPHVNFQDALSFFESAIIKASNFAAQANIPTNPNVPIRKLIITESQFVVLQVLTSSFIWLFVGLFFLFRFLVAGKVTIKSLAQIVITESILLTLAFGTTYAFSLLQIPDLYLKFLLNGVLQSLLALTILNIPGWYRNGKDRYRKWKEKKQ